MQAATPAGASDAGNAVDLRDYHHDRLPETAAGSNNGAARESTARESTAAEASLSRMTTFKRVSLYSEPDSDPSERSSDATAGGGDFLAAASDSDASSAGTLRDLPRFAAEGLAMNGGSRGGGGGDVDGDGDGGHVHGGAASVDRAGRTGRRPTRSAPKGRNAASKFLLSELFVRVDITWLLAICCFSHLDLLLASFSTGPEQIPLQLLDLCISPQRLCSPAHLDTASSVSLWEISPLSLL